MTSNGLKTRFRHVRLGDGRSLWAYPMNSPRDRAKVSVKYAMSDGELSVEASAEECREFALALLATAQEIESR